jgi:hypothetical protein
MRAWFSLHGEVIFRTGTGMQKIQDLFTNFLFSDEKVGVWGVISAHRIIGPVIYTVNAARYVNNTPCHFFST